MANFQLRWANRSQSNQDWMIDNGDNFSLPPDHVRAVNITIHNDYTYQVVVSTHLGNAHTSLSYTAATQVWTLNTHTPNEWQLAQGNGIVTLRCLLEDVQNAQLPDYKVEVESVEGKAYPAYQLYEDNNGTTWCSKVKMKSHAEGNQWIKDCLKAHPNTRVNGKPWTSNHQKGNIWP